MIFGIKCSKATQCPGQYQKAQRILQLVNNRLGNDNDKKTTITQDDEMYSSSCITFTVFPETTRFLVYINKIIV